MPVEIKAARTPAADFAQKPETVSQARGGCRFVLYGGDTEMTAGDAGFVNVKNTARIINNATLA